MDHFRWLRRAAKAHGVQVILDLDSMRAFLRKDARHWVLQPRFIQQVDGVPHYVTEFTDDATHLAGWHAVQEFGWAATKDKLVFKRAATKLGLRVPEFSTDEQPAMADVVLKRSSGSFGQQVHGPFRSSAERPLRVEQGEFYERFIEGRDLKIWFWGSRPVVLERDTLPSVEGDGVLSYRALIERRIGTGPRMTPTRVQRTLARCADVLRYDGFALDDVPAQGRRQRVEFRYGTDVMQNRDRETIDLRASYDPQWHALREAGEKLTQMLPEDLRESTMFTVDAVQDVDGRIWLLELNSFPTVHPLVYDPMVRTLVSSDASATSEASPLVAA